ncbi:MAG TPA: alpha/beta hydrolase-fold protein [Candidatus Paceibacterota bacterium]|nr:alpha/beta hydrolase-fold protein [Verrucomicrobiota bacterium]HRY51587.1 alpha/beta hydrolase-fold protein [Candidatus Paceibacterota bacterium]HSA01809.1 alpha/beta hydrolase-fold protein [Candidatus Paceibacterota bacterium]
MKTFCFLLSFILGAAGVGYGAAAAVPTPATNTAALGRRPAPVRSPEVLPNGQVTFRLRAPKAAEVAVTGQWTKERLVMARNADDIWTVTSGPIDAGVWEYNFQVDGLTMIDPGNPAIKPMREPRTSILHIPGQPPRLTDFQDVPHGVIRNHSYFSKSLGRLRELAVYTPPGYDGSRKRYPTLYLQHGSGDNQATWVVHGKAHWILDNLIAQGRARAMVIVMMDGHAALPGATNNVALFERDLLEDVMPFVETNYRVRANATDRAIVGLSMGGGQSLTIGMKHTDRFAWVGGFSASVPSREALGATLDHPETLNKKLKLLWIACGQDDFLLKRNQEFIALLKEKNLQHEWYLTGGDHSWPVWREYLGDIACRLFKSPQ